MSVVATAGAAAWVVPEILTAKPAAGATLSGGTSSGGSTGGTTGGVTTSAGTTGDPGTTGANGAGGANGVTTAATTTPVKSLAFTGLDIKRDAEIGAALVASGWAMQHWASRTPTLAAGGVTDAPEAATTGEPA